MFPNCTRLKASVITLVCLLATLIVGMGRLQIRLVVPEGFRGLIRVTQAPEGEKVAILFPRVVVPASGVVILKSVNRFFGWRRIVGNWQESGRPIPMQSSDQAEHGAPALWELPTTSNPEACFFIGTVAQRDALLRSPGFLPVLGRDRREDPK